MIREAHAVLAQPGGRVDTPTFHDRPHDGRIVPVDGTLGEVAITIRGEGGSTGQRVGWTFLTNHGHVLVCLASDPDVRLRDVATLVGITERAAQLILADLVEAGYVTRTRVGRRNRYQLHADRPLRHPLEEDNAIGDLLSVLGVQARAARAS